MNNLKPVEPDFECSESVSKHFAHAASLKGKLQRAKVNALRECINKLNLSWTNGDLERINIITSQGLFYEEYWLDKGSPDEMMFMTFDAKCDTMSSISFTINSI